jgi:hypothetical protein
MRSTPTRSPLCQLLIIYSESLTGTAQHNTNCHLSPGPDHHFLLPFRFPPFSYFYSYGFVPPLPPLSSPPKDLLRFSNQAQIRLLARLQPAVPSRNVVLPQVRSVPPLHFYSGIVFFPDFVVAAEILLGEIPSRAGSSISYLGELG